MANTIKVTLKKSTIGCKKDQIATVQALGLKKIGQTVEKTDTPQIRAARRGEQVIVYLPVNAPLTLRGDWSDYRAQALDLGDGKTWVEVPMKVCGGQTRFGMHPFYEDALILLSPREKAE